MKNKKQKIAKNDSDFESSLADGEKEEKFSDKKKKEC